MKLKKNFILFFLQLNISKYTKNKGKNYITKTISTHGRKV